MRLLNRFTLLATLALAPLAAPAAQLDITTATIADLQAGFATGKLTSEALIKAHLARIEAFDKKGPTINSIITLNPKALEIAKAMDAERKSGKKNLGPLHGIPVMLKDNIDTFDLPTTGGSQLLEGSIAPDDAFITKKLRDAGAIILAKVNLSEWAGGGGGVTGTKDPELIKAGRVPNGSSTAGGQTLNPHDLTRGPAGSSGGTGAAIAAGFGQFGLGSDTGGSVRGPSSVNGIAGLKPTLGLLSRDGIIPLALSFDTAGPMARSVYDVAVSLNVMSGVDKADPATKPFKKFGVKDYTATLKTGSLKGARLGLVRDFLGQDAEVDRITAQSVAKLKELGAEVIEIDLPEYFIQSRTSLLWLVMGAEFKAQITDYLKTTKPGFPKSFDDLVTLTNDPKTGYRSPGKAVGFKYQQANMLSLTDPVFLAARDEGLALMRSTIAGVLTKHKLDAFVYPTNSRPAQPIVPPPGPAMPNPPSPSGMANLTGFPDLIVPAGMTKDGLPVTLSFFGPAWSEPKLLSYGYDFEQAVKARVLPKNTPALPSDVITY